MADESLDDSLELEQMLSGKGIDWTPLTEDNWEEEFEKIPLFMTDVKLENIKESPAIQALQSMVYEEANTPNDVAQKLKEHGNKIYKFKDKSKYGQAIQFYTDALSQNATDPNINLSCLINRAQVHLDLKNFKSAALDCKKAISIGGGRRDLYVKASFRAAKALMYLERYNDALKMIQVGFEFETENEFLNSIYSEIINKIEEKKIQQRKEYEKLERKKMLDNIINCACKSNNSILKPSNFFSLPPDFLYKPEYDGNELTFPVIFIYPSAQTFDIVSHFSVNTTFTEIISEIFDGQGPYKATNIELMIPNYEQKRSGWRKIKPSDSLGQLLLNDDVYVDEDKTVRIFVILLDDLSDWHNYNF